MHLVFERTSGESPIKTNCNILALTWMPYYQESTFRSALFEYHQKQLFDCDNGRSNDTSNVTSSHSQQPADSTSHRQQGHLASAVARSFNRNSRSSQPQAPKREQNLVDLNFLNSRVAELYRRYLYARDQLPRSLPRAKQHEPVDLADKYGLLPDFGWLVVGNVGKIVGVTLTSLVDPPLEKLLDRSVKKVSGKQQSQNEDDLMQFDDMLNVMSNSEQANQSKPISRPDDVACRNNYNLRGHLDEVILLKWNELYQKLATVDSKGNVLIWSKVNERFTMQTPFYNRTKSVADFKWSNDGKTALICYTDSFILVGSSSGQRHWHSMLNLDDYHITCASWTPNDEQLLLGVSNGNVVVIDLPRSELTELIINQTNIRTMCWSSCEMSLSSLKRSFETLITSSYRRNLSASTTNSRRNSNTVVNHRRLSRDCSVFSRYRFCSRGLQSNVGGDNNHETERTPPRDAEYLSESQDLQDSADDSIGLSNILAIDFANNTIKLYDAGLDDPDPKTIFVDQESYTMSWSSDGRILAVAGFTIHTTAPSIGRLHCRYVNSIKFYNHQAKLIYQYTMNYTRYPITAFTWAHNDQRIFVATGPKLHCARVHFGIPPLSLLASSCIQRHSNLAEKYEILSLASRVKAPNVTNLALSWQSHNCPIEINGNVAEPDRSDDQSRDQHKCSMMLLSINDEDSDAIALKKSNNSQIYQFELPLKLKLKIDQLFKPTIRQPYDTHWTLSDIIWHVPRNEQRFYCTLVCYTSDRDIASSGHQYKTNPMDQVPDSYNVHATDQAKIFVLYVEFMGSLIPILRARRVGFLKPEFVIFDPENRQVESQRLRKVSDICQQQNGLAPGSSPMQYHGFEGVTGFGVDNCDSLHGMYPAYSNNDFEGASMGRQSVSDAEHYYNFGSESVSQADESKQYMSSEMNYQQQQMKISDFISNRSHHQEPMVLPKSYNLNNMLSLMRENKRIHEMSESKNRKSTNQRLKLAVARGHKTRLTEDNELIRIKSNIWGTKFRMINAGCRLFRRKAVLGSVVYKASILHLQPRQIFLKIKDMSNYCCLCSMHHHEKIYRRNARTSEKDTPQENSSIEQSFQSNHLLDMPDAHRNVSALVTPIRSKKSCRLKNKQRNDDKVMLPVGDAIRIAPKLEANQRYKYVSIDDQKPSTSSKQPVYPRPAQRQVARPRPAHKTEWTSTSSETHCSKSYDTGKRTRGCLSFNDSEDDVLTLSLSQGDQVRVEMSSLNNLNSGTEPLASTSSTSNNPSSDINEFLATNKTLKSIQTITQMIVDLSSKATNDLEDSSITNGQQPSPNKLVKLSPASDAHTAESSNIRAASKYVAPDTPVHRPRRVAARLANSGIYLDRTQSVTTTPLKSLDVHFQNGRRRSSNQSNFSRGDLTQDSHLEREVKLPVTLPPPPPSIAITKRLSSSAKRFFGGSLRSLQGSSIGYSNVCDQEPEDNEPLVDKSKGISSIQSDLRKLMNRQISQPSSPSKPRLLLIDSGKQTSDLSSLKKAIAQKNTTATGSSNSQYETPTKVTSWSNKSRAKPKSGSSFELSYADRSFSTHKNSCYVSSNESDDQDDEYDSSSSLSDHELGYRDDGRVFKRPSKKPFSVKMAVEEIGFATPILIYANPPSEEVHRAKRRQKRKSLCQRSGCCCSRELQLENRPPVWNKLNQVYQLDFGGRVTQESAKNLQIDYEGELALQFGRIDRFTYTLDYKYPFNAVQAMSIALASLTQRLK